MAIETARVILGDCLDVMRGMESNSVDLILTDIPFGEANRPSSGLRNLDRGKADIETFELADFVTEAMRIASGSLYIFCGFTQLSLIDAMFRENGISRRCIVWEKTNPSPMNAQHLWLSGVELCVYGKKPGGYYSGQYRNTVLRCKTEPTKEHPTQKPIGLFTELIKASTRPGDVVLDPCAGSGTTGVAAIQCGRVPIPIERDPAYHAIAERRVRHAQPALLGAS